MQTKVSGCEHPEEIDAAAGIVAEALTSGRYAEVAIAPGNGTRYCFLFVPVAGAFTYETPRTGLESGGVAEGGVWIARIGWPGDTVCYPLALMGRREPPAESYLIEKWFPKQKEYDSVSEDVLVFQALLGKIGELT